MDFIFDQFIELESKDGTKTYASMAGINAIVPESIDTCSVWLRGGGVIAGVKMPARVLVQKIAQRRQEAQKLIRKTVWP